MKLISSILFVLKFLLAILILFTLKFLSKNVQQGFICGDPSLSMNRKTETSVTVVWALSPIVILLALEVLFSFKKSDSVQECFKKSWSNTSYLCHRYFINLILMNIIVATVKTFSGAHRPHFFETCQPDKMSTCVLGTFVSDYECANSAESLRSTTDASMSFFSGHAATCVFSCLFICWYLQKRMKCESLFLIPFAQTSLICLSLYGSLSRISDHRNHWWDVMTGVLMGILVTYHTCYVLCKNQCTKPEEEKLPTEINLESSNKLVETEDRN